MPGSLEGDLGVPAETGAQLQTHCLISGAPSAEGKAGPPHSDKMACGGGVWEVGANLLHPLSQASECGGPLALTLVQAASGFRSLPRPASGAPVTKAIDRVG